MIRWLTCRLRHHGVLTTTTQTESPNGVTTTTTVHECPECGRELPPSQRWRN